MIELFFRMIKGMLACSHLLSTKQNGVETQAYMAIIACLLILIYTGRKPTKRTFEMICLYLQGWAELDEVESHIARLESTKPKNSYTGFPTPSCFADGTVNAARFQFEN